ncbi:MAG: permease prefix domain 1-containing protein, partial [Planctomycetota bacterium]
MTGNQLPKTICNVIDRVVGGTRLWPSEKRDVRAELESHFREGLEELIEEGTVNEQAEAILCDRFGDPKQAAKLIRRGKKRGRPMIWKIFIRTTCVLLLGMFATVSYAAWLWFGEPTPSVDYLAKINEPTENIPIDDRAWPILREVISELKDVPQELENHKYGSKMDQLKPSDIEKWKHVVEWVEENRHLVDRLDDASHKSIFGFIYKKNLNSGAHDPKLFGNILTYPAPTRELIFFLVLNSRVHMANNEFTEAFKSLSIANRLGVLLLDKPYLIEQLNAAAIIRMVNKELRIVLFQTQDRLSDNCLSMVSNSHVKPFTPNMVKGYPTIDTHYMFEDLVQYVFTDDGNGDGQPIPAQCDIIFNTVKGFHGEEESDGWLKREMTAFAVAAIHADRKDTLVKYNEVINKIDEITSLPLYDSQRYCLQEAFEKS